MRIVLLTAGVRGIGSYCINLYQKLREQGHEVLLISERKWEKQPIESFYQASSFMLFGVAPFVYRPAAVVRAIARFKPDIIHHHWPCGTMDFFFGAVARLKVPYMVTVHVSLASKEHPFDRIWYFLFTFYKRWLARAAAVNCISDFVRTQLDRRLHLPEHLVHRIYAGINEKVFHPGYREENSSDRDSGIDILFVGEIMPEKGIDMLIRSVIEASKQRDDLTLTIIGRGHMESSLKSLSREHSNINWVGFLTTREEIAAHYANADVTVLPTRWDEAFSLVPIESFACGTPVIATPRGGTLEQVTHGVTGFLLSESTEGSLTDMLISLKRRDLLAMRQACRDLVLARHTTGKMGDEHEALYKKVFAESNG